MKQVPRSLSSVSGLKFGVVPFSVPEAHSVVPHDFPFCSGEGFSIPSFPGGTLLPSWIFEVLPRFVFTSETTAHAKFNKFFQNLHRRI